MLRMKYITNFQVSEKRTAVKLQIWWKIWKWNPRQINLVITSSSFSSWELFLQNSCLVETTDLTLTIRSFQYTSHHLNSNYESTYFIDGWKNVFFHSKLENQAFLSVSLWNWNNQNEMILNKKHITTCSFYWKKSSILYFHSVCHSRALSFML